MHALNQVQPLREHLSEVSVAPMKSLEVRTLHNSQ